MKREKLQQVDEEIYKNPFWNWDPAKPEVYPLNSSHPVSQQAVLLKLVRDGSRAVCKPRVLTNHINFAYDLIILLMKLIFHFQVFLPHVLKMFFATSWIVTTMTYCVVEYWMYLGWVFLKDEETHSLLEPPTQD